MKIGVISDTHISPEYNPVYLMERNISSDPEYLREIVEPYFCDADAIIHAGDLIHESVIKSLEKITRVYAVAGNMDPTENHVKYGEKKIIEFGKFRIGLMHGWGAKSDLHIRVRQCFNSDNVNCIVFGHSHSQFDKIENGILMFNPGSPTDKRFAEFRSIGILHLEDNIWGEHIRLD